MRTFADHPEGSVVTATLSSGTAEVDILSYGAIIRDWRVALGNGSRRSVTLGFETFEPYLENPRAFGIIAGRIAGRVRNAAFRLNGHTYELDPNKPPHHIHGGREGFGKKLWHMEPNGGRHARLTLTSPDGEMGYPGTAKVTVDYTLEDATLTMNMLAEVDRPTPISLANHSYYNLSGEETVEHHTLRVNARRTVQLDEDKVPTGAVVPLPPDKDFRKARTLGTTPLDLNYCLDAGDPAAILEADGLRLTLSTDQPGLQVYNAYDMTDVPTHGHGGRPHGPMAGLALEAQHWPDAVNNSSFPTVIAMPGVPYRQTTRITIEQI